MICFKAGGFENQVKRIVFKYSFRVGIFLGVEKVETRESHKSKDFNLLLYFKLSFVIRYIVILSHFSWPICFSLKGTLA